MWPFHTSIWKMELTTQVCLRRWFLWMPLRLSICIIHQGSLGITSEVLQLALATSISPWPEARYDTSHFLQSIIPMSLPCNPCTTTNLTLFISPFPNKSPDFGGYLTIKWEVSVCPFVFAYNSEGILYVVNFVCHPQNSSWVLYRAAATFVWNWRWLYKDQLLLLLAIGFKFPFGEIPAAKQEFSLIVYSFELICQPCHVFVFCS